MSCSFSIGEAHKDGTQVEKQCSKKHVRVPQSSRSGMCMGTRLMMDGTLCRVMKKRAGLFI